jgi:hypothetical protein
VEAQFDIGLSKIRVQRFGEQCFVEASLHEAELRQLILALQACLPENSEEGKAGRAAMKVREALGLLNAQRAH